MVWRLFLHLVVEWWAVLITFIGIVRPVVWIWNFIVKLGLHFAIHIGLIVWIRLSTEVISFILVNYFIVSWIQIVLILTWPLWNIIGLLFDWSFIEKWLWTTNHSTVVIIKCILIGNITILNLHTRLSFIGWFITIIHLLHIGLVILSFVTFICVTNIIITHSIWECSIIILRVVSVLIYVYVKWLIIWCWKRAWILWAITWLIIELILSSAISISWFIILLLVATIILHVLLWTLILILIISVIWILVKLLRLNTNLSCHCLWAYILVVIIHV